MRRAAAGRRKKDILSWRAVEGRDEERRRKRRSDGKRSGRVQKKGTRGGERDGGRGGRAQDAVSRSRLLLPPALLVRRATHL